MTTGQLIISLIMIWAAGIALGIVAVVRIAVRLLTRKQK